MKALAAIAKGDEIFNDYGPLPRSELLRNYGYITSGYTQYDVVDIPMKLFLEKGRELFGFSGDYIEEQVRHSAIFWKTNLTGTQLSNIFRYSVDAPDGFDLPRLESQSSEILDVLSQQFPLRQMLCGSDFVNGSEDTRSWQKWLLSVFQNRLAEYPTSLEEDQKLPADDNDDRRVVMAIMVRIGEKEILTETINKLLELEPSGEPPAKRLKI